MIWAQRFIAPVLTAVAMTFVVGPTASAHGSLPSARLDLTNWKLQLPVDGDGSGAADEVKQPTLANYEVDQPGYAFHVTDAGDGVRFRANAGGFTTAGSAYARTELREMNGASQAAWSRTDGNRHTMTLVQAITKTTQNRPHIVAGQIHDGGDDVLQIRLEGARLFVKIENGSDGNAEFTLTDGYVLGTKFTVVVEATTQGIGVLYNGVGKVANYQPANTASTWYFKAGAYLQSNVTSDSASDYGEVVIYGLTVDHGQPASLPGPTPAPGPSPTTAPALCAGRVATISGTPADDVIHGTDGVDVISAGDGNDAVFGLGGNDIICGGAGDDVLAGGAGAKDQLLGEDGDDTLIGGRGPRDRCAGGPGRDIARKCEIRRSI